jgi:hypothetical protein
MGDLVRPGLRLAKILNRHRLQVTGYSQLNTLGDASLSEMSIPGILDYL